MICKKLRAFCLLNFIWCAIMLLWNMKLPLMGIQQTIFQIKIGGFPMNEISNTQLITAVNQVLMSANLPTTNEVVQYVIQSIMPFLNQMTVQMNQTQASFQCILQSLVNQNRQQIIEIAKLKQIREEMPRKKK